MHLISAPTNLGLRPPEPGAVPGTAKAPEALRDAGLHARLIALGADEAGVVLPGRYVDAPVRPGGVRNQEAIIDHAKRTADRIGNSLREDAPCLVLGGDCTVLLGAGLALARAGGYGLVHIDGHTDFRGPHNSNVYGAVAGEDLAAVTGRHIEELSNIEGRGPYFDDHLTVHIGHREDDEHAADLRTVLPHVLSSRTVLAEGGAAVSDRIRAHFAQSTTRYWIHLDVDVLDPVFMPAVDSPDPGGLDPDVLVDLLRTLASQAVGASVCIFDPDLDGTGALAHLVADIVVAGLSGVGSGE